MRSSRDPTIQLPWCAPFQSFLPSLVLTNHLLILVGGEMRNQWLDIISGWLGAQRGEVVVKKIVGLREEVDITSRWGRGNDLQGGLPPRR